MKYAVIGLGEFGKAVALKLARRGVDVIAVDTDIDLVDDVKDEVSVAVKLDPTDDKELRAQGINQVDVLIAAIERDFESNEIVVVLAKRMGIKKVIARADEPTHGRIFKMIGADEVIHPEEDAAEKLSKKLLYPTLKNYFEFVKGYSLSEIEVTNSLAGKTLSQLNLPKEYGINLIGIRRKESKGKDNSVNLVPMWSDELYEGDMITIVGSDKDIERFLSEIK